MLYFLKLFSFLLPFHFSTTIYLNITFPLSIYFPFFFSLFPSSYYKFTILSLSLSHSIHTFLTHKRLFLSLFVKKISPFFSGFFFPYISTLGCWIFELFRTLFWVDDIVVIIFFLLILFSIKFLLFSLTFFVEKVVILSLSLSLSLSLFCFDFCLS